jgi:hypothetical protein
MNNVVIAALSIAISVCAQFMLKAGMGSASVRLAVANGWSVDAFKMVAFNPYVELGFTLYGLGAVIWLSVLAKWDVSKAYPLVSAGFIKTCVVGDGDGRGGERPARRRVPADRRRRLRGCAELSQRLS